ncbi:ATP-binding protein [Bacillus sp. MUM 116]|uniref:ATP-binding protein n=1 Tax=Bacillus sp. MUM 116 TaxID=1678002 RepID=UPI0008F5E564|nr:HAMP domain-containing sensor histidine kinase [Bacillus sp. MUM 116]OIK12903.1 ATP-binding protein [Bacillus sp. MUM 116]
MIVLVTLLWLMSSIIFLTNPRNEKIRWACLIGFFGGCGGLSVLLGSGLDRPDWILLLDGLFSSLGHLWTPYAILIFGLLYSDTIKNRKKKQLCKLLFLIPTIIMYFHSQVFPEFKTNYVILSIWVVPYVVVTNILLIYSAWRETRPSIKRQRILTVLLVVPMVSFALTTGIILEALGISGVWNYNPWMIGIQFSLFVYFTVKYGVLGVRIRIEKQRRDSTMKAVTSGSALLNHTIKNEIAKIDLLVNQLKEQVPDSESIDLVLNSANHLLELSTRIQSKLDIMELKETHFWISNIIDSALGLLRLDLNRITVLKQYEIDVQVYGDPIHLQEAFLNIFKNAIEAMDSSGQLLIKIYKTRKFTHIDFIDNGKGIENDKIPLVLDPFYSTKGRLGNYGLGLSYCYNVMQKHGGNISIKSKKNQGTTITLSLPNKRILDTHINLSNTSGEIAYE